MSADPLAVAITGLMRSPDWPVFEAALKEERDKWIVDTRDPRVYQNHAELVQVTARVAECDWILGLFDDCRKRIGDTDSSS